MTVRSTTKSMQAVSARTSSGLDRREHADPQLVAPELAVGLGVHDAVGAQRRRHRGGVHRVVEVDRAHHQRALGRVGHERRGVLRSPRPSRRGARRTPACGRRRSRRGRRRRASSRAARPAATGWPPRACCRSGPCASSRARWRARGTRGSSARAPSISLDPLDRGGAAARRARGRRRRRRTSAGRSSRRRRPPRRAGRPPAPEVASISTSASPARARRPAPSRRWRSRCGPRRPRPRRGRRRAPARRRARPRRPPGRRGTGRRR